MFLLSDFNRSTLPEKIATLTTIVVVVGLFYKLGYYQTPPMSSTWVVGFFNIIDLAYASLKLIFVYMVCIVLFNNVFVIEKGERNIIILGLLMFACCAIYFIFGVGEFYISIAILLGLLFSLLFFHKTKSTAFAICMVYMLLIPYLVGSGDVRSDLDQGSLPSVKLKVDDSIDWRMLDKIDSKILLINSGNTKELKIVEFEEVDRIVSTK